MGGGARVELVGVVPAAGRSGPVNGMHALQRHLARRLATDRGLAAWFSIVPSWSRGADVVPWFWSTKQRADAVACAKTGRPFVEGPNVLFLQSRRPRIDVQESALLDASSCRAMFCHSPWYRDLIARHRGKASRGPIVLWPYPIDPVPGGPLPIEYDLLVYDKSKAAGCSRLLARLSRVFPRSIVLRYGSYDRRALFDAAQRARACAYVTDDDHGPLALQEILLAGCPVAGVRTGAAFVEDGASGTLTPRLPQGKSAPDVDIDAFVAAVERARMLDRDAVRGWALRAFDADRIVDVVVDALQAARAAPS